MKRLTPFLFITLILSTFGCTQQDTEQLKAEAIKKHSQMEDQRKATLKALVQKFYDQLSDPNNEQREALSKVYMAEDWASTPQPLGGPGREGFVNTLAAFGGMIPDLNWEVKEMLVDGDRVIVRSIASGTPNSPEGHFFGVPTKGEKKFEIQTIDIHTIKDNKMTTAFHCEDWATAIQQVSGQ